MKLTEYIAVYAACLSSAIFLWNVLKSRSHIKVTVVTAIQGEAENNQIGVNINIQNPSHHTVHLSHVGLMLPPSQPSLWYDFKHRVRYKLIRKYPRWSHTSQALEGIITGMPLSIEPRNSHDIFIPEDNLWEMLGDNCPPIFAASVQDALWRNKYSKPHDLMPRIEPDESDTDD